MGGSGGGRRRLCLLGELHKHRSRAAAGDETMFHLRAEEQLELHSLAVPPTHWGLRNAPQCGHTLKYLDSLCCD